MVFQTYGFENAERLLAVAPQPPALPPGGPASVQGPQQAVPQGATTTNQLGTQTGYDYAAGQPVG